MSIASGEDFLASDDIELLEIVKLFYAFFVKASSIATMSSCDSRKTFRLCLKRQKTERARS